VLKTLLRISTHVVPIRSQKAKQTVHPAVPNSDTLIDLSVTVYQICIDQGSPKFLGEDHISKNTTVQEQYILHKVIFSEYVTFYEINRFFGKVLFFHCWQNVFCGTVKRLRTSDLAPGP